MIVVVTDVTLRFVFNIPVRGAYDIVSFALLIMVFFGIGPVIVAGKEIVMDLFDHILPGPALKGLRDYCCDWHVGNFPVHKLVHDRSSGKRFGVMVTAPSN